MRILQMLYNAGADNISRMRKEAAERGFDPDKWFNNVEVIVAERIGMETTTYVRNIYITSLSATSGPICEKP